MDLAPGQEALAVDLKGGRVYRLSEDLRQHNEVVGTGSGPSEVSAPAAVARMAGGEFVVADQGRGRVKIFDATGRVIKTAEVIATVSDLAVDSAGNIYIAHTVFGSVEEAGRGYNRTAISVLRPEGESTEEIIRLKGRDLSSARLAVPGPNEVRVTAANGRLFVWYPAAGVIDIHELTGRRVGSTRICVADEIDAFYARQRRSSAGSATVINLLSDVMVRPDGSFAAIGPLPTSEGSYHIDFFDAAGRPTESWVTGPTPIQMPPEIRFGGSPEELWAFDYMGLVARLQIL